MRSRFLALCALVLLAPGCAPKSDRPGTTRDTTAATPSDTAPPTIEGTRVVLPPRFEQALAAGEGAAYKMVALSELDPGITDSTKSGWAYPWAADQVPNAALADFDGDGTTDVALLQKSSDGGRAVAVLDGTPPRVVAIHDWLNYAVGPGATIGFYLTRRPAGPMPLPDFTGDRGGRDSLVVLPHDGVTVAYFGKAATTYYFEGSRFQGFTTSD